MVSYLEEHSFPIRPDPASLGINIHEAERSSVLQTNDLYSFNFF